jgi:hypothetical protein
MPMKMVRHLCFGAVRRSESATFRSSGFRAAVNQWLLAHHSGTVLEQVAWYDELSAMNKTDEEDEVFDALAKALGKLVNL